MDLNVQTSQDRLVKWDRNRIVEALQLETGLEPSLAGIIAAEVETQIQNAGITVLTASLIRELVGAKLIEHGLTEENDLHRRLGVPLYDASRIIRGCTPETLGATPNTTDDILARAVKKEYALAEVFSSQVTQAHLLGRIHISELEFVDRLYACEQSFTGYPASGPVHRHAPETTGNDNEPALIVSSMMKQYDFLQAFFSGPVDWPAFNFLAAPFLAHAREQEIRMFARTFISECAYRAAADGRRPARISLCWNVPAPLSNITVKQPVAAGNDVTYKTLEPVARRLFQALLEVCQAGDLYGDDWVAPVIEVVLDNGLFQNFEGDAALIQAARTALQRPNLCFVRKESPRQPGPPDTYSQLTAVWHRITLNLPRAAISAENEKELWKELERLCEVAVTAHREKRDFIEAMLDPGGCTPLAPLACAFQEQGGNNTEQALFTVAVDGLFECAAIILGKDQALFNARIQLMQKILTHLADTLKQLSQREGMRCVLSANSEPKISNRFAVVDSGLYPRLLDTIITANTHTQALSYTTGVALPVAYALNPFEITRIEGLMHILLEGHLFTSIPIPVKNASENSLADLLKKIVHQTQCKGLWFSHNLPERPPS